MSNVTTKLDIEGIPIYHCTGHGDMGEHYCVSEESFKRLLALFQKKGEIPPFDCHPSMFYYKLPVIHNPNLDVEEVDSDNLHEVPSE